MRASAMWWRRRSGSFSRHRRRSRRIGSGTCGGSAVQSALASRIAATASDTVSPVSNDCAAGQHLVEHAAERPDVGAPIDRLAARLFGAHVAGRAENQAADVACTASVGDIDSDDPLAGSASAIFARPKSRTLTLPPGVTLTFAGFRSRWMMSLS